MLINTYLPAKITPDDALDRLNLLNKDKQNVNNLPWMIDVIQHIINEPTHLVNCKNKGEALHLAMRIAASLHYFYIKNRTKNAGIPVLLEQFLSKMGNLFSTFALPAPGFFLYNISCL